MSDTPETDELGSKLDITALERERNQLRERVAILESDCKRLAEFAAVYRRQLKEAKQEADDDARRTMYDGKPNTSSK